MINRCSACEDAILAPLGSALRDNPIVCRLDLELRAAFTTNRTYYLWRALRPASSGVCSGAGLAKMSSPDTSTPHPRLHGRSDASIRLARRTWPPCDAAILHTSRFARYTASLRNFIAALACISLFEGIPAAMLRNQGAPFACAVRHV